jgi:two-component system, NarL family, nitrate/nitrite response regulator NarL
MAEAQNVVVATAVADARERWAGALRDRFVVRDVADWGAVRRVMSELKPGVLMLDIALPGLGGVVGLADVRQRSPTTRTIVLSESETEGEGVDALLAGAMGYCALAVAPVLATRAVDAVLKGEFWVRRNLVNALVATLVARVERPPEDPGAKPDRRRLERLTLRQREVAESIAKGASNKEIARRLNVTERTVKAHLTEMFRHVGVYDRLHLALLLNDVRGADFELRAAGDLLPEPKVVVAEARKRDGAAEAAAAQSD